MKKLKLEILITQNNLTQKELYKLSTELISYINKLGYDATFKENGVSSKATKGLSVDFSTLIITLASAGAFNALIQLLRDWLLRAEGRHIKIILDNEHEKLELDYTPNAISERELENFVRRLNRILRDG